MGDVDSTKPEEVGSLPIPIGPEAPLAPMVKESPLVRAEWVEQELEARARILKAVLNPRFVGEKGFIDQNGSPWLSGSAGQRIARVMGIVLEPSRTENGDLRYHRKDGTDSEGPYFEITIEGVVYPTSNPILRVAEMGKASTRDKFYNRRQGGDSKRQPIENMSEGDIREKALMNLWARAIQGLLGLKQLTWPELRAYGFDQSKATHVDRQSGEEKQRDAGIRKKLGDLLLEMTGNDKDLASAELEVLSKFKDKTTGQDVFVASLSDSRLKGKWLGRIYGAAKQKHAAWKAKASPPAPAESGPASVEEPGAADGLGLPDDELPAGF